jgi:hypothetical protein
MHERPSRRQRSPNDFTRSIKLTSKVCFVHAADLHPFNLHIKVLSTVILPELTLKFLVVAAPDHLKNFEKTKK